MKTLNKHDDIKDRPDIIRLKRVFGIFYGVAAGLGFAAAAWGWDGYVLYNAHGYFPWLKLVTGGVLGSIIGGLAGWLAERLESSLLSLGVWLTTSVFFAWLAIAMPLVIAPAILSGLDPQLGELLNYSKEVEFSVWFWVAMAWIVPFTLIIGLAQLPVVESGVFAMSLLGNASPFIFCIVVMGISGVVTDSLVTVKLRDATVALNNTIQFVLDNEGGEISKEEARRMYVASVRTVGDHIHEPRKLVVGGYDKFIGVIHVYTRFGNQWFDCSVVYNQPSLCALIPAQ
ncbi:MAG: hypothetical protein C4557_11450 [Anaerolineaceae bacterium]|jgi:hypothetical protein|nr:MAG: hypothetical protein C4557_11450 [Anaerolineaceae bacterium]